ncbi:MAG: C-GCAxxG-C-C family (seleno)protein [Planctomycetota bacterium]
MNARICTYCGSARGMTPAMCRVSKLGTVRTFLRVGTCSETSMHVVDRAYDHPLKLEENALEPLAGIAAGAEAYRRFGASPAAEAAAVRAAQRLVEAFREANKEINCLELIETRWQSRFQVLKYFVRGGPIGCVRMAARFGPEAVRVIDSALSEVNGELPSAPVSCAAELAKKMGASEMHAVMAAGLAGGIGFSGGGCGALGAAIWILGIQGRQEGVDKKVINARITDTIERFLKASGHEFECSEIVGRNFENAVDHNRHLREGGCAKIIEALASEDAGRMASPRSLSAQAVPSEPRVSSARKLTA